MDLFLRFGRCWSTVSCSLEVPSGEGQRWGSGNPLFLYGVVSKFFPLALPRWCLPGGQGWGCSVDFVRRKCTTYRLLAAKKILNILTGLLLVRVPSSVKGLQKKRMIIIAIVPLRCFSYFQLQFLVPKHLLSTYVCYEYVLNKIFI